MTSGSRFLAAFLVVMAGGALRSAAAAPKENAGSSSGSSSALPPLERVDYRPASEARVVGEPSVRPGSDDVAFLEQSPSATELVVCLRGARPARWTLPAQAAHLHVYWSNPNEITLGTDLLNPKMVVRWRLARN